MTDAELQERREDIAEIDSVLEGLQQAVSAADTGALEALLSPTVQAVFSGGALPVRGRDDVMATWRRHLGAWQDVTIRRRDTVVRIHGDVAWAHFLWDGEGRAGDALYRLQGERWTAVLVWEEGAWRFAQTHTSVPYTDWDAHRV